MDAELRQLASRIAEALERQNKILARLIPMVVDDDGEERCPRCGSVALENTSTMGNPRMTCCDCTESWEVADG